MADYYTQFSVIVPIPEGKLEQAVKYEAVWRRDRLEGDDYIGFDATPIALPNDGREPNALWINSGESGSPDNAADFIQALLDQLDIDGGIHLCYGCWCNKPRFDGFGGGGAVITRDEQMWCNEYDVAYKAQALDIPIIN